MAMWNNPIRYAITWKIRFNIYRWKRWKSSSSNASAIFGSLERFIGIITEHFGGAFPTWLAPVQVKLIPVNNQYHLDYVNKLKDLFFAEDIRVEVDDREEKLGYKIREAQTKKIPYQLVIGDKEVSEGRITYRRYGQDAQVNVSVDEFLQMIKEEIRTMKRL